MRVFHRFETEHNDLIHDIAYDHYGKRLATCSSDQTVKIWDFDDKTNKWLLSAEWKAHIGSVWKLGWAHPEYGQILATCSFDRTVDIWEEESRSTPISNDSYNKNKTNNNDDDNSNSNNNSNNSNNNSSSIGNGNNVNKGGWKLRASLNDARKSVVDIHFAPKHMGLKLATCAHDGFVRIYEAVDVMNLNNWSIVHEFENCKGGNNAISWNPSPFGQPCIAVASNEPALKIWQYSETYRRWQMVISLAEKSEKEAVNDVAWAPNMGRSYHLIASASKDGNVRIWKIKKSSSATRWESELIACFSDHNAEVWRVEWNLTGTILASTGDNGTVRLWKADLYNKWSCYSIIKDAKQSNP